jgi:signal transduction histidine kinase/DNA-binding response OmpR family regulator
MDKVQKRVWIVDDDETALILAEAVLTGQGFQVETFNDPLRAIQTLASSRPDLIVLDVMMPGLDGFEFCRRLRGDRMGRDVPVLIATSLGDIDSINRAYEAGATDFTTKPLNWTIETHRLRYMLRSAETAKVLQIKERETRMAKEDWERTFNSIPDVVTLLSPDLKVLRANAATAVALQKPIESLIGVHCYQLFQDSQEPCRDCPIMRVIETGAPASAEKNYRNPAADCLLTGTAVTDGKGQLLHVVHIARDQTKQKRAAIELERLNLHLIEASRQAGMAEVATGVLHNVGNVLNSVNVSADLLRDRLGRSHLHSLLKAIELLRDHSADLATFLTQDLRGKRLPEFLINLGDPLRAEQLSYQKELESLGKNIEHINQIVSMQQNYARFGGVTEVVDAGELLEDALRLTEVSLSRQGITLVREHADSVPVEADKHKVLQILVNLLRNAQQALTASDKIEKVLTVGIEEAEHGRVRIHVRDNGMGILPENLTRIFQHGFTTKKDGHGFGLHYGANIAKEMGGALVVRSDGRGQGATFILELPATGRETGCEASRQIQWAQPPGPFET